MEVRKPCANRKPVLALENFCNFSRWLSVGNSQVGQAYVIILLMSALWRVILMLVLNRSLLNREYILVNVLKALASIIYMCNFHVAFLSKITLRYFTLFASGMFRPFSVRWDSGSRLLWENYTPWVSSSLIFIFQCSHQVSTELRPCWGFLTTKPFFRSVAYRKVNNYNIKVTNK
jgi:hypothetical protein